MAISGAITTTGQYFNFSTGLSSSNGYTNAIYTAGGLWVQKDIKVVGTLRYGGLSSSSDERFKLNEVLLNPDESLASLMKIKTYTYDLYSYNVDQDVIDGNVPDPEQLVGPTSGILIQQILADVPELAYAIDSTDETHLTISYQDFHAIEISAIQSLKEENKEQALKILSLEQRLLAIEERLNAIDS
tara:strand:+ start:39 stop:599 length:561 start_codon:yes stop_codon:yes gene_type:complete